MSVLSSFFKESDSTLGVFYPRHYLIGVLRNLEVAQRVVDNLHQAGFAQDDAMAVGGQEIVELAKEETGVGTVFMQGVSRLLATGQIHVDHDLAHARHEAGFLAVHCPTEETMKKAWAIIEPEAPLDARYYTSGGIEHLAGDFPTD